MAAGSTNAQAAERLFVSPSTIKTHLAHIFRKLDVVNRAALVAAQAAEGRSVSG
ncbi:helix-turn-helix transcriptional regulator [Candidatus Microthrix sp.]|uniref:response regulator transcription factor n=1 Tax=Candidatus Neomicrothrix sp. TaxID=2719034 RepID=UPI0032C23E3A